MTTSQKIAKSEASISAMDAIYHRRAVRDYTPEKIDETVIRKLLDATLQCRDGHTFASRRKFSYVAVTKVIFPCFVTVGGGTGAGRV